MSEKKKIQDVEQSVGNSIEFMLNKEPEKGELKQANKNWKPIGEAIYWKLTNQLK